MSSDPLNLKLPVVHTEIRRNFCSARVINIWNDIPYEIKSAGNSFWTVSKTSSITGWIPERPMKLEKRCFKLSHPWYINIITPIKPIKIKPYLSPISVFLSTILYVSVIPIYLLCTHLSYLHIFLCVYVTYYVSM